MNKLMTIVTTMTAVAALSLSATAHAGHDDDDDDDRYGDRVQYAKVVSSRPIYRDVRVSSPRQECYDERVVYDDGRRRGGGEGVGALLGAVVGGVVGNRFGEGQGKAVATAAGAVIGASAGASVGRNNGRGYREPSYGYEQRCSTIDEVRYEQRIEAYDVAYKYRGRVYNTRLPYDPGKRIAVNVDYDVRPAEGY